MHFDAHVASKVSESRSSQPISGKFCVLPGLLVTNKSSEGVGDNFNIHETQISVRKLPLNRGGVEKDGLKVYFTKHRSLRNKIDPLRGKTCVEKFDVTTITEIWVDIVSKNFMPESEKAGYQMFHADRRGRGGGGVALYVREHTQMYRH